MSALGIASLIVKIITSDHQNELYTRCTHILLIGSGNHSLRARVCVCVCLCVCIQVADFLQSLPGCEEQAKRFREEVSHTSSTEQLDEGQATHNVSNVLECSEVFWDILEC